jgi:hypothetical protein
VTKIVFDGKRIPDARFFQPIEAFLEPLFDDLLFERSEVLELARPRQLVGDLTTCAKRPSSCVIAGSFASVR